MVAEFGDQAGIVLILEFQVSLAAALSEWYRALQIGGAVDGLRRTWRCDVTLGAQARLEQALERARTALGETSTVAWNEGRSLTVDQVVSLAAQWRTARGG